MTRSEKVRRFFRGKDREAKLIQIAYVGATLNLLKGKDASEHFSQHDIDRYQKRDSTVIDYLQRQVFILDNPKIAFEIEKTERRITQNGYHHDLYRVILSDDDEVLFKMTWNGRY